MYWLWPALIPNFSSVLFKIWIVALAQMSFKDEMDNVALLRVQNKPPASHSYCYCYGQSVSSLRQKIILFRINYHQPIYAECLLVKVLYKTRHLTNTFSLVQNFLR